MEEEKKKHKISVITGGLMIGVAIFYDLLQVGVNLLHGIPIFGNITALFGGFLITIWAWLTFYLWFKLLGVSFLNPKRFGIMSICGIADTVVSALPAWVAAVALIIATTRAEELAEKVLEKTGAAGAVAMKAVKTASKGV